MSKVIKKAANDLYKSASRLAIALELNENLDPVAARLVAQKLKAVYEFLSVLVTKPQTRID